MVDAQGDRIVETRVNTCSQHEIYVEWRQRHQLRLSQRVTQTQTGKSNYDDEVYHQFVINYIFLKGKRSKGVWSGGD